MTNLEKFCGADRFQNKTAEDKNDKVLRENYREHFKMNYNTLRFRDKLPQVTSKDIWERKVTLPPLKGTHSHSPQISHGFLDPSIKTVLLDLDETLIHSNENW